METKDTVKELKKRLWQQWSWKQRIEYLLFKYIFWHFTKEAGRQRKLRKVLDKMALSHSHHSLHDHNHCPEHNSPCGFEGKHRCCLCGKEPC